MTITQLKQQLRQFYKVKQINELVEKIRNEKRNGRPRYLDKYFLDDHIARVLYRILERSTHKLSAGEEFKQRMVKVSLKERGEG